MKENLFCFIADEPALKDFFLHKGHAGLLPCCLCRNVILHRLYNVAAHIPPFVTTACVIWDDLRLHDDASIHALYSHLADAHGRGLRGEKFEELELVAGLGYNDFGLAHNQRFHVASMLMYDWSRIYVVGGLLDIEIGQCMQALTSVRSPSPYAVMGGYLSRWTWPHRQPPPLGKLFDATAIRSHFAGGAFKAK
jgi:hypothetical protein